MIKLRMARWTGHTACMVKELYMTSHNLAIVWAPNILHCKEIKVAAQLDIRVVHNKILVEKFLQEIVD
jgi:hypothetical protein